MDVGVRELKQHLSAYLRRVEQGETIRITDRGVPKALISPVAGADRLQAGIAEGWIRAPTRAARLGEGPRFPSDHRTADLLRADRDE